MKSRAVATLLLVVLCPAALVSGCAKKERATGGDVMPARHEHKPLHGGTPVVLGNEAYHVEFVRDASAGTLQAYIFDGELENFIRSSMPSFDIVATVGGESHALMLKAVPNPATGETVGDTALFEAQADWLKTTGNFDAVLKSLTIRGRTFADVKFNFPSGNDRD
jgi:hypothetical protein